MSKKLQTLLIALIIFTCTGFTQNVFTVNNNPGMPANYHSLQNALDSVPAGSTILLQGSALNYGYTNVRKPVVIYGPGFFLGQNPAPNTQADLSRAMITHMYFQNGSQGSIVSGVSFVFNPTLDGQINQRIICDTTSNITLSRCYFDYVPFGGFVHNRVFLIKQSSNITIKQSYINLQEAVLVPLQSSGIVFSNNIFVGGGVVNIIDVSQAPYDYSFYNNSISATMQYIDFTGGSFFNNVIIQNNPAYTISISGNMTVADHNVSNVNIFPGGGTNITNADGNNTYVGFSNPNIVSQDGMWQLKPGSAAIGYASGGGDCGAYGTNSYILSGIPAIPNIYFANTQQSTTTPGGVKVHLKIKANN
jgi:hypothetical protein